MKFSAVFLALTMTAASVQAFNYQSADADLASRSNSAYDDVYARSDALLEFTTRDLVEELEARMNLVQRGNSPYIAIVKNQFHKMTGNKFNKQGSSHGSHSPGSSAPPTGQTDPNMNAMGGGSAGGSPGMMAGGAGGAGGAPGMGGGGGSMGTGVGGTGM